MTREYFVLLYQHSNWANRRIRGLLRDQSRENERARELFSHLLVGEGMDENATRERLFINSYVA